MILIADDHSLYRDSIKQWLLTCCDPSMHIETVDSLTAAIAFMHGHETLQLIMLDLCMPGMRGAYSIRDIKKDWPDLPILIVSGKDDPLLIKSCIDAGAAGFLSKKASGEDMQEAIKQLLAGRCFIPQSLVNHQGVAFSNKQKSILSLLAEGQTNREISQHLHLTEGTIKQYVSDILSKLDVNNRVQAGIRARQILGIE
ncbi:MAG: response regulator transcription factor [Mariprofundus sp.]|nr:response regulator transcription factor [Mariprofundus sp.]